MSATTPLINPMMASVIGLLVVTAVLIVVVVAVAKHCVRRRRRSKATRFGQYSREPTFVGPAFRASYVNVSSRIRSVVIPTVC